jgi:hypothetical protein
MNVDTGFMGEMDEVLRRAKAGERVIPATIIPDPFGQNQGVPLTDEHARAMFREQEALRARQVQMYGPRKPLRKVRAELLAAKDATE